jgi:hypothetical protein
MATIRRGAVELDLPDNVWVVESRPTPMTPYLPI